MEKLKPGGFIIADNVLWSGKVLETDAKSDKETIGIKAFNDYVANDPRVEQVILSVRDGLLLCRKID
jgi:predicted O-methyltransferase YrrM